MHLLGSIATADVPLTPENVRPGWVAMLVVFILIGALIILMRSFARHARRAREPWPGEKDDDKPA
jgi:hypothetical protein